MNDDGKNSISFSTNAQTEYDGRLNLLYEIGRILASGETMNEAAPQILEAICRNLQFELGELWCMDKQDKILRLENAWHFPSSSLENFVAESRQFKFTISEGLPGKVWAKNAPVWLENIGGENNMPRKFFAEETGLQSGFAFPILLGE
ncbi:MAG: GAF domain-containing protein, partial [Acidobacteriota bacterium]|nr:GAF domain-containing protein [Acidobacteriota bacterium]